MSTKIAEKTELPERRRMSAPRRSQISTASARKSISSHISSGRMSVFERRRTTLVDIHPNPRRRVYTEVISVVFHLGSLILAMSLSISCAIMGAIYWTRCPGNGMLPVILLSKAPLIGTEVGAAYIILARNYEWVRKLVRGECMNRIHTATGFLFILTGLWFSILAFWTFEKNISYNPSHENYCHPQLYRFAVGFVITVFLLFGFLIFVFFCGCLILATLMVINSRLKTDDPGVKRIKKQSMVTYGETLFVPDNFGMRKLH